MTIINQLIKHLKTTLDRCLRVDHVDDASKRLELKKELSDDFKVRSKRGGEGEGGIDYHIDQYMVELSIDEIS